MQLVFVPLRGEKVGGGRGYSGTLGATRNGVQGLVLVGFIGPLRWRYHTSRQRHTSTFFSAWRELRPTVAAFCSAFIEAVSVCSLPWCHSRYVTSFPEIYQGNRGNALGWAWRELRCRYASTHRPLRRYEPRQADAC